jgi:hypothetical protein
MWHNVSNTHAIKTSETESHLLLWHDWWLIHDPPCIHQSHQSNWRDWWTVLTDISHFFFLPSLSHFSLFEGGPRRLVGCRPVAAAGRPPLPPKLGPPPLLRYLSTLKPHRFSSNYVY